MSTDSFKPTWRRRHDEPDPLLGTSPYREDQGRKIGRDPRSLTAEALSVFAFKDPLSAIRAFYLEDCGNDPSEVRKCVATGRPLWPFRMGSNPFHANAKPKQKKALYALGCANCAIAFEAPRRNTRYCSPDCKRKAGRKAISTA